MLTPTKKKYLLTIYMLSKKNEKVRSVEIAKRIGVNKASVTTMLPVLEEDGLIERNADRSIGLTGNGEETGKRLYAGYEALRSFFEDKLKSSEENAKNDAVTCICNLTDENTENMIEFVK